MSTEPTPIFPNDRPPANALSAAEAKLAIENALASDVSKTAADQIVAEMLGTPEGAAIVASTRRYVQAEEDYTRIQAYTGPVHDTVKYPGLLNAGILGAATGEVAISLPGVRALMGKVGDAGSFATEWPCYLAALMIGLLSFIAAHAASNNFLLARREIIGEPNRDFENSTPKLGDTLPSLRGAKFMESSYVESVSMSKQVTVENDGDEDVTEDEGQTA